MPLLAILYLLHYPLASPCSWERAKSFLLLFLNCLLYEDTQEIVSSFSWHMNKQFYEWIDRELPF